MPQSAGPRHSESLRELIPRSLREHRWETALIDAEGNAYTYESLRTLAEKVAAAVVGSSSGSLVVLHLQPGIKLYASMIGVILAGLVPLPLSPEDGLDWSVLTQCEREVLLITDAQLSQSLEDVRTLAWPDVATHRAIPIATADGPDGYAVLTSGTTGYPKAIVTSDQGTASFASWAIGELDLLQTDRWVEPSNPYSDLAIVNSLIALIGGVTYVPLGSGPQRLLSGNLLRRVRPTIFRTIPHIIDVLRRARQLSMAAVSDLRIAAFGGDRLSAAIAQRIRAMNPGVVIMNTYGLSETTGWNTMRRYEPHHVLDDPLTVGLATPLSTVEILADDGFDHGEIAITSSIGLALSYISANGEHCLPTQSLSTSAAGGFRTKDLGRFNNGELVVLGRSDRHVKVKGFKVDLEAVDEAIKRWLRTEVASVLARGSIHVFVQANAAPPLSEIYAALSGEFPHQVFPRHVHALHAIPRTRTQKVALNELQAIAGGSQP